MRIPKAKTSHFHCLLRSIALAFTMAVPLSADDLPAFPGADGAGKYAHGGRGGDVYHVTNLSDPYGERVEGTLRHAIETADGPRTIVFDKGGTIHLESTLMAQDLSHLTIAGQTAPGGGITIADASFFVRDAQHVIVQYLRFAPGDALSKPEASELPGFAGSGNIRPFRVWNSKHVMADHLTTRWGQEDNISVTHNSSRVTVQNSIGAEGLLDADHRKGTRSYAALINGHGISYLRNYFAHNRARNPRVGIDGTRLEFNNNVVYNTGYRAAALSDRVVMDAVGNIGLTGPAGRGPGALIRSQTTGDDAPMVFAADNYYDEHSSQPLDFSRPSSPIVMDARHYPIDERFDFGVESVSDYEPIPFREAYIYTLSRTGASHLRDTHDRRIVRDAVERTGNQIDRPVDVGGWPEVDPGEPVVSTARDGIADGWKEKHGLDINQAYHKTFAEDGYTYLEHYLHSLMPPPMGEDRIAIGTADGNGADAQVHIHDGVPGGKGDGAAIQAYRNSDSDHHDYIVLRFDLSAVEPGTIADARLELTAFSNLQSGTLRVYALDPEVDNQNWDESRIDYANAPGFDPADAIKDADTWRLGDKVSDNKQPGDVVTFDHPNLAVFLNSTLAHYRDANDSEQVTLILRQRTNSRGPMRFAAKEATSLNNDGSDNDHKAGEHAPRLILTASETNTSSPTNLTP